MLQTSEGKERPWSMLLQRCGGTGSARMLSEAIVGASRSGSPRSNLRNIRRVAVGRGRGRHRLRWLQLTLGPTRKQRHDDVHLRRSRVIPMLAQVLQLVGLCHFCIAGIAGHSAGTARLTIQRLVRVVGRVAAVPLVRHQALLGQRERVLLARIARMRLEILAIEDALASGRAWAFVSVASTRRVSAVLAPSASCVS